MFSLLIEFKNSLLFLLGKIFYQASILSFFLSKFGIEIENICIPINLLIDFFQQFLSLFVFQNHSSHFNIEFLVYLVLHSLIHSFHKLLYNIFDTHHTLIFSLKFLLEASADINYLRVLSKRNII